MGTDIPPCLRHGGNPRCPAGNSPRGHTRQTSPAYKAYHRGKVLSKVQLRTQEMKLARIGSPLALDNTRKNLLDMEDDE